MKNIILLALVLFVGCMLVASLEDSQSKTKASLVARGFTVEGQKRSAVNSDSVKKEMAELQSKRMQALSYWRAKQMEDDVNFITKYFYENRPLTVAEQNDLVSEQQSKRLKVSTLSPEEMLNGLSMLVNNQPLSRLRVNIDEAQFDMTLVNDMMMAISRNDLNEFNNKKNALMALIKPTLERTGYVAAAMSNIKDGITSRVQRVYDYLKNSLMPNFNKEAIAGKVITEKGTIRID